jgi:transposase InsO family protein
MAWLALRNDSNAKLIRSMSRKGCSSDNAVCEVFFGRLKTELFYPRNWQETTIEEFIQIVDFYIHWYNANASQALHILPHQRQFGIKGGVVGQLFDN